MIICYTKNMKNIPLHYPFNGDYKILLKFGRILENKLTPINDNHIKTRIHTGIDFALPINTPVLSCDSGMILKVSTNTNLGNHIVIKHVWGLSLYANLNTIAVQTGEKVAIKSKIGLSGSTLLPIKPHLHFGLQVYPINIINGFDGFVDPDIYFIKQNTLRTNTNEKTNITIHAILQKLKIQADAKRIENKFNNIEQIKKHISQYGSISNKTIQNKLKVSNVTAYRYCTGLIQEKLIKRIYSGRTTKYTSV